MFASFFGLTRLPFTPDLPVEALFRSAGLEETLSRLRYVLSQRAIALLVGEPGSGKTATLRALVAASDPATHKFLYLVNPGGARGLYRLLCHALGLVPAHFAADLSRQLQQALLRLVDHGVTPVLLCDEVQDWPAAVLQELRYLLNAEMDARAPCALVLVGHPDLRHRLALESLRPLAQRVAIAATLGGLNAGETADYIEHQLRWAGATRPLFTRETVELITHYSRGLPRQINRLCTASLLAAAGVRQPLVEEPCFRSALKAVDPESA